MNQTNFRIDWRWVSLALLIVIVVMIAIWRPWVASSNETITLAGQSTVKAAPDKFVFYPTYQATGTSSTDAISAVSKKGNDVVAQLKTLGVDEKAIAVSSTTNKGIEYLPTPSADGKYTATYTLTVTLADQPLAQKVLDYIVTTSPLYGVSPQSTFSDAKRKELEAQARALALTDAKQKGEQTTATLGGKLGRLVSVTDAQWGGVVPMMAEGRSAPSIAQDTTTAPVLLTGEQDVTYSVSVVYRLR